MRQWYCFYIWEDKHLVWALLMFYRFYWTFMLFDKLMVRPFPHLDILYLGPFRLAKMTCKCICQSLTLSALFAVCCEILLTHYLCYTCTYVVWFWIVFIFWRQITRALDIFHYESDLFEMKNISFARHSVTYFSASHLLYSQYLSFPSIIGMT